MILGRIIGFFTGAIGKYVGYALLAAGFIGAIFAAGKRDKRKDQKVADLQDYVDTNERIADATVSTDRLAATKRLRDNKQVRD